MPNLKDQVGEKPQPTGGGMRRMLADGSESMAEFRDFMGQLRGKSPQEVLGAVANSSLVRSTLIAAVGFALILVGVSVAVYHMSPEKKDEAAAAPQDPKPSSPAAVRSPTPENQEPGPKTAATSGAGTGEKALDNLGITEAKDSDPEKNPLENSLDNLLDGAK